MNLEEHSNNSFGRCGLRAPDIHRWIDGYFDPARFERFLVSGNALEDDPFAHRSHRHCREAAEDAVREFAGSYSEAEIRAVFESHLLDDYEGYVPVLADFENPRFLQRYHELPPPPDSEPVLTESEKDRYFGKGGSGRRLHAGTRPKGGFAVGIVLPTVISLSLFIVSLFLVIEPVFYGLMMDGKRRMLKELVSTAVSAIDWYHAEELAGNLTTEAAKATARLELEKVRYGDENKDYFWIIDTSVRMVMHPWRPELNGRDLTNYRDIEAEEGKNLFAEAVALCLASDEGFIEYLWQWKDEPGKLVPKLSFVSLYKPWNWIVGSGVYVHDVEAEIAERSNGLLAVFGLISAISVLIMVGVLLRALSVDRARTRSESALEEARDRYRSLVNSSREAHALVIGDRIVYTNPRMRELTGYPEEELAGSGLELLFPGAGGHSAPWPDGRGPNRIRCRDGTFVSVRSSSSRVFFSREAGTVISVLPLATKLTEYLEAESASFREIQGDSLAISGLFAGVSDENGAFETLGRLTAALPDYLHEGRNPEWIRHWVFTSWKCFALRIAEFALKGSGPPPAAFAIMALGSNGRGEITLFSDQDNAIVFDDSRTGGNELRPWFLSFARLFCEPLDRAGFRFCPGGILASSESWCLGLSEWQKRIERQASGEVSDGLQQLHALCDCAHLYGDESLTLAVRASLSSLARKDPGFIPRFARPVLGYPLPVISASKPVNIKDCLLILEGFARIYALKSGISAASSIERINALSLSGVIASETRRDYVYLFESLWKLRFRNQLVSWTRLEKNGDLLQRETLTGVELRQVSVLIRGLPNFTQKINRDLFGGMAET